MTGGADEERGLPRPEEGADLEQVVRLERLLLDPALRAQADRVAAPTFPAGRCSFHQGTLIPDEGSAG